jgi:hypothetical protein
VITADTITREQIDQLWAELTQHESGYSIVPGVRDCIVALGLDDESTGPQQREARARCAERINARSTR